MFIPVTTTRQCERCGEDFRENDFQGEVCGWCARDLQIADAQLIDLMDRVQ